MLCWWIQHDACVWMESCALKMTAVPALQCKVRATSAARCQSQGTGVPLGALEQDSFTASHNICVAVQGMLSRWSPTSSMPTVCPDFKLLSFDR